MVIINTTEDLLRLLDENEEFRTAVRNKVLTEELIKMPAEFVAFQKNTKQNFDGMETRLTERIDGVETRLTERIDGVGKDIDRLGTTVTTELKAQGSFRGTYAQSQANRERVKISNKFAHLHGVKRTDAMGVRRDVLKTWLKGENTAVIESLRLGEQVWETFLEPDMVAAVQDLMAPNEDPPLYYICVEASYSIDDEDVIRATDHAKIVQAITGLTTYAIVAGVRLDDQITTDARNRICEEVPQYVETGSPDFVYWYRLTSSDLRPPEPR